MIVQHIGNDSIAAESGIQIGDDVVAINDQKIRDIIDYRYFISDEILQLEIIRAGKSLFFDIEKEADEDLGISFKPIQYKCCGNKCIFCFIDQNPPNLRPNLYFKDEDFRLSFLHGNYVTLTNISKADLQRIVTQRLSPLYVSVHAINPAVRSYLLGLKKDDRLLEKIKFLTENHIELHAQIVLCPTINDWEILDQTIFELAKFYPDLKSIAIVPVGLTKHRATLATLKAADAEYSKQIIQKYDPIADQFKQQFDNYFLYLADEFYLSADVPIPETNRYEDFYQYENGVGMMRNFMDLFFEQSKFFPKSIKKSQRIQIVTAELAQPFFEKTIIPRLNAINGLTATLAVVKNFFYGTSVKVTGLLTGSDIFNQLKNREPHDLVILPENLLNVDGLLLDDWTVNELEQKLNLPIKAMGLNFSELF